MIIESDSPQVINTTKIDHETFKYAGPWINNIKAEAPKVVRRTNSL